MLHPYFFASHFSLSEGFLWSQSKLTYLAHYVEKARSAGELILPGVTLNQWWITVDKCALVSLALEEGNPECTLCIFPVDLSEVTLLPK